MRRHLAPAADAVPQSNTFSLPRTLPFGVQASPHTLRYPQRTHGAEMGRSHHSTRKHGDGVDSSSNCQHWCVIRPGLPAEWLFCRNQGAAPRTSRRTPMMALTLLIRNAVRSFLVECASDNFCRSRTSSLRSIALYAWSTRQCHGSMKPTALVNIQQKLPRSTGLTAKAA